ncbi:MAG: hypothetical protein DHS20C09_10820 [marine bacterium B5-7]|nr:MAG: hypothetical protein DHS20C09_10820 [marine bacterium B5-7]
MFTNIAKISTLFMLLFINYSCLANTTKINTAHVYVENNTYYLDASYDFELSDEAYKALRHGISFEIHAHFQLRLKRAWLWDETISEKTLLYKLEHKPLTENFLTIDLLTGLRHSYDNLDAALNHIKTISKVALFDQDLLIENKTYIARIRAYLDIESLPPPMRPQAYFSPNWDLSSEWYEWEWER